MKLSVILINHNSRNELRLALTSLFKAASEMTYEVFVVDNASTDRSLEMLTTEFPNVQLIVNNKEESLSKANNQAMRLAKGEYILLLSPDTITGADSFVKLNGFMDQHPLSVG